MGLSDADLANNSGVPTPAPNSGVSPKARCQENDYLRNWLTVPLSEEEQRILHEIERSFYAGNQAPGSAGSQHSADVRRVRLAAVGFVVSLVLLLVGFAANFVFGALMFLLMVATGATLVDGIRRVGGDRLRSSAGRLGSIVTDPSRRAPFRGRGPRRFRGGDEDDS
jgi:hypothetical protein